MEKILWSNKYWYTQEEWGLIHPDKPWNWYDKSCISIDENNSLNLTIKNNPKKFNLPQGEIISNWGIGLISSCDYYPYGTFTIEAKLPKGKGLWPAFWLYDHNDWPPEIDIFEGYSGKNKNYKNTLFKCLKYPYNVESCLHRHNNMNLPHIKPLAMTKKQIQKTNYKPLEWNTYSLKWTPYDLIFLINNIEVRRVSEPNIMNYLQNRKMKVIINTHVTKKFKNNFTSETDFIIKYFKYKPL